MYAWPFFSELKTLQWLPIIYRINLLPTIDKALWDLALTATFCFILCGIKALEYSHLLLTPASCHPQCLYNTHHLTSGLWIIGHNFSSDCIALFNLLCHHSSWPSLSSSALQPLGCLIIQMVYSWCSQSTRGISLLALKII